jgi:hypothetical protein
MDGTRGTEHLPHKVLKKLQSAEEQAGVEPEISGAGSHPSGEGLEDKMAKAKVAGAPRAQQLVYVNDGAFSGYQGLPSHLTNDPKSSWMDGTRGTEHLPHKVLKKLQSAEEQAGVEPEISGAGSHPSGEGLEDKMAKANVAGAPRAQQLRVLGASGALPAGYHILKPGQQLPVGARIVKANR